MRKIIVLALIITLSFQAQSQTKFGIQAGAVTSKLGSYKSFISYKAGIFAEVPLSKKLFLAPELNLVPKGAKTYKSLNYGHQSSWELSGMEDKIFLNYVEVPLLFLLKPNPQKNGLHFGAGPVIGMGVSGTGTRNLEYSDNYGNIVERKTEEYKPVFDGKKNENGDLSHFNKFEFGAGLLAGYALHNGVRFRLQFRPGFTNIAPNAITWEATNNYVDLMIGYGFR